jgi:hypothetical protein
VCEWSPRGLEWSVAQPGRPGRPDGGRPVYMAAGPCTGPAINPRPRRRVSGALSCADSDTCCSTRRPVRLGSITSPTSCRGVVRTYWRPRTHSRFTCACLPCACTHACACACTRACTRACACACTCASTHACLPLVSHLPLPAVCGMCMYHRYADRECAPNQSTEARGA